MADRPAPPAGRRIIPSQRLFGLLLVTPALALVAALFLVPLGYSVASAFTHPDGSIGLANFAKAFKLYSGDIAYTIFIVVTSTALTALVAIAIAGYLTMGETPWLVTGLAWLYPGRCSSRSSSRRNACARFSRRTGLRTTRSSHPA